MNKRNFRPYVYIAAPLFTLDERNRNESIAKQLRVMSFDVFLPQVDGLLLHDLVLSGIPLRTAEKSVYDADISAMERADIIIAILDGATIDDGVAYELGFCGALKKTCIALQTDIRRQLPTGNNPMIECGCEVIFSDPESLFQWLAKRFTLK